MGSLRPALALLDLSSIATGIVVGDAMVKRAPLEVLYAGTIHPGRYLVLVAGDVAPVEEALDAAAPLVGPDLVDRVFLPDVHPEVVEGLRGMRRPTTGEALGVIETSSSASTIRAADAGRKGADVVVRDIRLGDGLGGKGYVLFGGIVAEVEAAVEIGSSRVQEGSLIGSRVVASLHPEMEENLAAAPRFGDRIRE